MKRIFSVLILALSLSLAPNVAPALALQCDEWFQLGSGSICLPNDSGLTRIQGRFYTHRSDQRTIVAQLQHGQLYAATSSRADKEAALGIFLAQVLGEIERTQNESLTFGSEQARYSIENGIGSGTIYFSSTQSNRVGRITLIVDESTNEVIVLFGIGNSRYLVDSALNSMLSG